MLRCSKIPRLNLRKSQGT